MTAQLTNVINEIKKLKILIFQTLDVQEFNEVGCST